MCKWEATIFNYLPTESHTHFRYALLCKSLSILKIIIITLSMRYIIPQLKFAFYLWALIKSVTAIYDSYSRGSHSRYLRRRFGSCSWPFRPIPATDIMPLTARFWSHCRFPIGWWLMLPSSAKALGIFPCILYVTSQWNLWRNLLGDRSKLNKKKKSSLPLS